MRIGVIGAGNVGGTLGRRWAALGHAVAWGVRRPAEGAAAVKGGDDLPAGARVTGVAEAARDAEVLVLTVPWGAVPATLAELAAAGALDGRVLVDATNPIAPGFRLDAGPAGESGAERIQAMAPGARVVKAFNTTGYGNMADPSYDGAPTVMPVAGDDAAAREVVLGLAREMGFDAIDAGPLVRSRQLEHLAMLWISLAMGGHGRGIAFRLVRR